MIAAIAQEQSDLFQKVDGGATPTSPLHFKKGYYGVHPLDRKIAQSISVANHYLHRKAPCSFAFGLFTEGVIAGVVLYGTPSNRNLRTGLCGPDEASVTLT